MEVGHDDEANDTSDDAKKFDAVEATDAAGEIVGDLLVKDNDGGTGGKDDDAEHKPTNGEFP